MKTRTEAFTGIETSGQEVRGKKFLQVGAVERGLVEYFVQQLARKGFAVRIAEGPKQIVQRVLLGPFDGPEIGAPRDALKKAGFDSFQRDC